MNLEVIKQELNQRMILVLKSKKRTDSQLRVVHRGWSEKVAEADSLINTTYCTLDEVLTQKGIVFHNKREKEGFVSQLEPTINDIVIRNMSD